MSPMWACRPLPKVEPGSPASWHGRPGGVAELTHLRRELREAMRHGELAGGSDGGERLLLAFQELGTNALLHGGTPVDLTVTATSVGWLVTVSDAAVDRPPTPAVDRDPVHGGMGLPMVARMSRAHGWTVDGSRKVVWARLPYLELLPHRRVTAAISRSREVIARSTGTAARLAATMETLAAEAGTAGRLEDERRYRRAATHAHLRAERGRWLAITASPPAPVCLAG